MSRGTASPLPSREVGPPLFGPHTSSLCVLAAPSGAPLARPVCVARTPARACALANGGTLRRNRNTITHAARQAGTRYRKAEIDNAGGPPAPYPNLDTRPAVAPGSLLVRTARYRGCLRSRRFLLISCPIYRCSFTVSCPAMADSLQLFNFQLCQASVHRWKLVVDSGPRGAVFL